MIPDPSSNLADSDPLAPLWDGGFLDTYLTSCSDGLGKCVDVLEHQQVLSGISATLRLHCLRFNGNGEPMVRVLADTLYEHIIDYALNARNRPGPLTNQQSALLTREAKRLFILPEDSPEEPDETGDAGELLLYLLIHAVLRAPQMIAKMELKTNRKSESKGSDGVHMAWNPQDKLLDVYFGEAKLKKDLSSALSAAMSSIASFHADDLLQHECTLVTKFFKYADGPTKDAITSILKDGKLGPGVRVNHACLVGYDWNAYASLNHHAGDVMAQLKAMLVSDAPRLRTLLQKRLDSFALKRLRFEFFLLPFERVQQLRSEFNRAMK